MWPCGIAPLHGIEYQVSFPRTCLIPFSSTHFGGSQPVNAPGVIEKDGSNPSVPPNLLYSRNKISMLIILAAVCGFIVGVVATALSHHLHAKQAIVDDAAYVARHIEAIRGTPPPPAAPPSPPTHP